MSSSPGEVGATWALIAAAGSGERLGIDRPKAFAVLGGRPLLAESLDRLDRCPLIDAIVVAAPPGWEEPSHPPGRGADRVEGRRLRHGRRDAGGVRCGRAHRGSRGSARRPRPRRGAPARRRRGRREGARAARRWSRRRSARTAGVGHRSSASATGSSPRPSSVKASWLRRRHRPSSRQSLRRAFAGDLGGATDCASLVERSGGRVAVVDGDPRLLKVTTAADLALVESFWRRRRGAGLWIHWHTIGVITVPGTVKTALGRVALKAVVFDVGETLVDEERWGRELAARIGLQPHVFWAALGVTIARGEEHDALWAHLGIAKPDGCVAWDHVRVLGSLRRRRSLPRSSAQARSARGHRRQPDRGARGVGSRREAACRRDLLVGEPRRAQARSRRSSSRSSQLMECDAVEVAYVGDRVDNDVLPAARGRASSPIHVRRGPWGRLQRTPPEAALGLDDLASLPDALASLA